MKPISQAFLKFAAFRSGTQAALMCVTLWPCQFLLLVSHLLITLFQRRLEVFGGVTTLSYVFAQLSNMKILITFSDGTKIIYVYL